MVGNGWGFSWAGIWTIGDNELARSSRIPRGIAMADVYALKAGQQIALKTEDESPIPPLHGEVAAVEKGHVRLRIPAAGRDASKAYLGGMRCVLVWDEGGRGERAGVEVALREGDDLVVMPQSGDLRDAQRSPTSAVFTYEVLAPEDVEDAAREVRNTVGEPVDETLQIDRLMGAHDDVWEKVDEEFGRLGHQVAELNSKVDYLVALTEGRSPDHAVRRYIDILDFSGTGLSFVEKKALPVGSDLRMTIELSRFPRQAIPCISQVARSEPQIGRDGAETGEFMIGVRYTTINEDDRERIIHYIFRIQRRSLRNRRERGSRA
jgi:hypothetical protein